MTPTKTGPEIQGFSIDHNIFDYIKLHNYNPTTYFGSSFLF